jgi:hypothetical protein
MGFALRPEIVMTHDVMIREAVSAHDIFFLTIPGSCVPSVLTCTFRGGPLLARHMFFVYDVCSLL